MSLRLFGDSWVTGLDQPVNTWFAGRRTSALTDAAVFFDHIGSGLLGGVLIPIALVVSLLLIYRRRPAGWLVNSRAEFNAKPGLIYAIFLALGVIGTAVAVQILKKIVARERPTNMIVTSDFGSYPSGHSAHAAVLTVALALVFRRWWVWWIAGLYTTAMMASRVYLGAHWLTDTVAGALIGASVAVLIYALLRNEMFSSKMLDSEMLDSEILRSKKLRSKLSRNVPIQPGQSSMPAQPEASSQTL